MPAPATSLHHRLQQPETLICPGVFNALVARMAKQADFESVYISGGATANVAGVPDTGLLSLTEFTRTIREIVDASGLPVVADADTGYGEEENAVRTIVEYGRAGAAALHVEDQVFPKRCGHLDGKQCVPADDFAQKIKAMSEHRPSDDFLLIARTDAAGVHSFADAVARGQQYRDAGADMIFPEGLRTEEEFSEYAKACPGLLLANMTEFGKTPQISAKKFESLGYDMVIYPLSMMRLAMGHVARGLAHLQEHGSVEGLMDEMQTRTELYESLGYQPGSPWWFPSSPD
ncbi:MAG: isocitrate lyase/phosphoenolpyruvate mutase family protein [Planctomycetota bacterium]|jgi:methylisocitrate lyase